MRILYLHQYFVPPDGSGGTRSYEFARRLIAHGHEVCIVTSTTLMPERYRDIKRVTRFEIEGIPVIVIPVPYSNHMPFGQRIQAFIKFALLACVQTTRQPADVIFATSTPLTIAIPAIVGKLWQRIPIVFEVRDLWPELPIAIGALKNPILIRLAELLEYVAYHASAHVVALSPGMAEGVIQRGLPTGRVSVIPNSSDVDLFDVPPERGQPIRERLNLSPDDRLIVYTGTFGLINGVDYLVRIAAELAETSLHLKFLLVGSGKEGEKIAALAKETGVYDTTLFIWEPQPKSQIPAILAAATVATSLFIDLKPMWNNSANKFFDALAAGKPVAINYGGWQKEILESHGAGIHLSYNDVHTAALKLAEFVSDETKLNVARKAAKELAITQFDRDLLYLKFEHIIRKACDSSG